MGAKERSENFGCDKPRLTAVHLSHFAGARFVHHALIQVSAQFEHSSTLSPVQLGARNLVQTFLCREWHADIRMDVILVGAITRLLVILTLRFSDRTA